MANEIIVIQSVIVRQLSTFGDAGGVGLRSVGRV